MGFSSVAMSHLGCVYPVICLVGANPLDPDDTLLEINRYHQTVVVALDVEDNPLGVDDAGRGVVSLHIGRLRPLRLADFIEPSIKRGLDTQNFDLKWYL